MARDRVVIVGAGMGGLSAAVDLAARGLQVTVVERAGAAGGKLRELAVGDARVDAGPTVFTMRWVFDELLEAAGARLEDHVALQPAEVLASHAWPEGGRFDLYADAERSAEAVGEFAGAAEARRFRAFQCRARRIYRALEAPFIRAQKPNLLGLTLGVGLHRPADQWSLMPYRSLWGELGVYFRDPRLRQLFARYATYCGASPFRAPATLMLVAEVEQQGVWLVEGGMRRLPEALERVAVSRGAVFRYGEGVARVETTRSRASGVVLENGERIEADFVVLNADAEGVAAGVLGPDAARAAARPSRRERSLSAVTFAMEAECDAPLQRHNVFFSADYPAEFRDIEAGRLPQAPTVYVCAQDRDAGGRRTGEGPERLFAIINAPANGDRRPPSAEEIAKCRTRMLDLMQQCGAPLRPGPTVATTPADFDRLFPGTGGALYGRAGHGWNGAFRRPGARTKIPGLYLAGGSVHPGPGVPMAALSGRLAAQALMADRASTRRWVRAATPGGMWTPSARTGASA